MKYLLLLVLFLVSCVSTSPLPPAEPREGFHPDNKGQQIVISASAIKSYERDVEIYSSLPWLEFSIEEIKHYLMTKTGLFQSYTAATRTLSFGGDGAQDLIKMAVVTDTPQSLVVKLTVESHNPLGPKPDVNIYLLKRLEQKGSLNGWQEIDYY